jgi:ribosomal protein L11 methyltransferase
MPDASSSVVARFPIAADVAQRVFADLTETLDFAGTVVSVFENANGWSIALHFGIPPNETATRALVGLTAGTEAANAMVFETVAPRDWVRASLDGLSPVAAGRFLIHGAHDRARVPPNRIGIQIEAALAFGTGHHGTTRGCLLALDRIVKARRPRRILDVGTGSGVLAIAAAKAMRRAVLASDLDMVAVRSARENARGNRVGGAVAVVLARGVAARRLHERAPFDLVFANILLAPLVRMATPLARLTAPGARVVLSGLLTAQANAALAAYRIQGLTLERRIPLDGWTTLVLRRR